MSASTRQSAMYVAPLATGPMIGSSLKPSGARIPIRGRMEGTLKGRPPRSILPPPKASLQQRPRSGRTSESYGQLRGAVAPDLALDGASPGDRTAVPDGLMESTQLVDTQRTQACSVERAGGAY